MVVLLAYETADNESETHNKGPKSQRRVKKSTNPHQNEGINRLSR